ncbi:TPA: hypothetical protein DCY67_03430 [Candidatus Acetothermia bacterium]|nr:hypothetical protein [Candidatus Acetothermia bacterium]
MYQIYVDDSRDGHLCVFSALAVFSDRWREAFSMVRQFRRDLRDRDGIPVHTEFHAWKFVSGRGRLGERIVPKVRRCEIFKDALRMVAGLPGARLFSVVFPAHAEERAFERLLNRIHRTMEAWDSRAIRICDQGKETVYTRLTRRMGVYNPIPSCYGTWPGTGRMRNIPIDRILEDPVFKRSDPSYFIQLVDFCAYSLLRQERPIPSKTRYGLDQAFALLSPIYVREASRHDPDGIIRP